MKDKHLIITDINVIGENRVEVKACGIYEGNVVFLDIPNVIIGINEIESTGLLPTQILGNCEGKFWTMVVEENNESKKMTVQEIEKQLGYKVEIIG